MTQAKSARATAKGPKRDKAGPAADEMPFEDAMKRLGEIVESLEEGDLPLEASLSLFEEGVKLAAASGARLDAAEKRVEKLMSVSEDGEPELEPFPIREEEDS